jgi:hypothetical protein
MNMDEKLQNEVDSMQTTAKTFPDTLLKQFIYIYWSDDDVWYRAQILRYLESCRRFRIVYDDKTQEKIDLTQQKFVTEDRNYKEMAQ